MTIVYCGELSDGGTCRMRLTALRRLGHTVIGVNSAQHWKGLPGLAPRAARKLFGYHSDLCHLNGRLLRTVEEYRPDVVWVDKGLSLRPLTLVKLRALPSHPTLIHYSPDDMGQAHNQSRQYLASVPLYDLHVTTKSYNVTELRDMGARDVLLLNNAFCPDTHRPLQISPDIKRQFGGLVGFVGAFEDSRAEQMLLLADSGVPVRIWGGGWGRWARSHHHQHVLVHDTWIWGDDYARAICSFDINLGFLRKLNRDLQTTRSVEIPACGGFLLAERTAEHESLFCEGKEAEYFGGSRELLYKVKCYLACPEERLRIAHAGRQRCLESGYSYDVHVRSVLARMSTLSFKQ